MGTTFIAHTRLSPQPEAGPYISYAGAFDRADAFLLAGRYKNRRRVASNTELRRIDADTIALVLHSTAVVTYHRDGTFTIFGGGWNTVTTKDRIRNHAPVQIHSEQGRWVVGYTGELTPARVSKCRSCKHRGTWLEDDHCEPRWYTGSDFRSNRCQGEQAHYRFKSRYTEPCKHGSTDSHFIEPCEHGSFERHVTGQSERSCYRCNGTGTVDYGSKRIPVTVTADDAYRVDAAGTYLGPADTVPKFWGMPDAAPKTHKPKPLAPEYDGVPSQQVSGGVVLDRLGKALPALTSLVRHPVSGDLCKVSDAIVSLNDTHRWSRERIADWLETLDVDLSFPTPTEEIAA